MIITFCLGDRLKDNVVYTRKGRKCKLTVSSYHRLMLLEDRNIIHRLPTQKLGFVMITSMGCD